MYVNGVDNALNSYSKVQGIQAANANAEYLKKVREQRLSDIRANQPIEDSQRDIELQKNIIELQQLKDKMNVDNTDKAFKNFFDYNDVSLMNKHIPENPMLQNVARVDKISTDDKVNSTKVAKSLGIDNLDDFSDEDKKSLLQNYFITTEKDGTKTILDAGKLATSMGYFTRSGDAELDKEVKRANARNIIASSKTVKEKAQEKYDATSSITSQAIAKYKASTDPVEKAVLGKQLGLVSQDGKPQSIEQAITAAVESGDMDKAKQLVSFKQAMAKPSDASIKQQHKDEVNAKKYDFLKTIKNKTAFDENDLKQAYGFETKEDRKNYKNQIDKINDLANAYKESKDLVATLNKPNVDSGWVTTLITDATKLLNSNTYKKLSDEQKAKQIATISKDTQAGMILSKYLNSISGTAVADQEYARVSKIFNAGAYANKESYIAAVKQFTKGMKSQIIDGAKLHMTDLPYTSMKFFNIVSEDDVKETNVDSNDVKAEFKKQFNRDMTDEEYNKWLSTQGAK